MEDTATVEAPASSSPTTTPTSNEPTVTTDRPSLGDALKTFHEAERVIGRKPRGQAAAPSSPAPTSQPEGATTPPDVPADASAQPPAKSGFIPTAEHIKAVENARTKTTTEVRAAVEQEFRQKHAPVIAMSDQFERDRAGFFAKAVHEAFNDPRHSALVRSIAEQEVRGSQRQQAPAPTDAPPPDFQDGQGNQFYSAKAMQARDAWLIQQVKDQVLGEVEPALQTTAEIKAEREAEQANRALTQQMSGYIVKARTDWKHFTEHEAEIKQAVATMPFTSGHPAEEAMVLREAYDRIVGPKLSALEQKRILADLQSRAHASTLNPASTGAPSGIPKNVRAKTGGTFKDALAWAAEQSSGR